MFSKLGILNATLKYLQNTVGLLGCNPIIISPGASVFVLDSYIEKVSVAGGEGPGGRKRMP